VKLNVRKILVVMLLGVLLYGGFAIWRGIDKMGASLSTFHWWSFAAACGLAFGNYCLRYLKWEFYLARLGIDGVKKSDSFLTFLSGFVLTVTPGKVGEVFKSLVLFETYQVPMVRTGPIVIAERVTDVLGIVVLIVLGSIGFQGGLIWAAIGGGMVVALIAVISSRTLSLGIIGLVEKLPGRFGKMAPKLRQSYESLAVMLKPRNLVVPTILSLIAWELECLALWVILRGFGETTPVSLATFFYATSTLAGAVIPVPGGLGVTESALMGQMVKFGRVAESNATAAMILVRFSTLWFAVLVGFVALTILKRKYPMLLKDKSPSRPRDGLPE
jgi:uncharacterized protein (TIRG00374 family)